MITSHWANSEIMEIWDGITIQAQGKLVIRVHRGNYDFYGFTINLLDPFSIPVFQKIIPEIIKGEYWQIEFPLTNYLMQGSYQITATLDNTEKYHLEFVLKSRKNETQVFLYENRMEFKNLRKRVNSISFPINQLPQAFTLQLIGEATITGATNGGGILETNVKGTTQKTITWKVPVQPSYLPVDVDRLIGQPDEYYIFNKVTYSDEPGLEISHLDLNQYRGTSDSHYPIRVIQDVIGYIHRNMRYVRQSKERGLRYALKYGRGDCTEYSAFAVALLRKIGIRARLVSGMGRSLYNNWISHAFIEVFIYGTWIPVDIVKPPKPYLQLGNRGELIGLGRGNWLDPAQKDLQIKFMASKESKPKIEINQKVTEAGYKSLNKTMREVKPNNRLSQIILRNGNAKIARRNGVIEIKHKFENITSLLILAGKVQFGKIVFMQYIQEKDIKLDYQPSDKHDREYLVLLDNCGQAKLISPL